MIEMIPQIRAQERLENIADSQMATGNAKRHQFDAHIRQLEREIYQKRQATAADLQKAGIQVINK